MATKTIKTESTPRGLQKTLIATMFTGYLLVAAFTLWNTLQQYPTNQNLSAYYLTIGQLLLTPLIFMLVAWALNPRKLTKLGRVFESLLITLVGVGFVGIVEQVTFLLPLNVDTPTPIMWMAIPVGAALVFLAGLVLARFSKLWK
jgi:hypothetical protein